MTESDLLVLAQLDVLLPHQLIIFIVICFALAKHKRKLQQLVKRRPDVPPVEQTTMAYLPHAVRDVSEPALWEEDRLFGLVFHVLISVGFLAEGQLIVYHFVQADGETPEVASLAVQALVNLWGPVGRMSNHLFHHNLSFALDSKIESSQFSRTIPCYPHIYRLQVTMDIPETLQTLECRGKCHRHILGFLHF